MAITRRDKISRFSRQDISAAFSLSRGAVLSAPQRDHYRSWYMQQNQRREEAKMREKNALRAGNASFQLASF